MDEKVYMRKCHLSKKNDSVHGENALRITTKMAKAERV